MEWSSTEDGPKIVNLIHLQSNKVFNDSGFISNIVNNFNFTIKNQSNSLSLTLDSDNILISSLNIDSKNISKSIRWYESEILGSEFCNNYYNYYYPMLSNDDCLLISLSKVFKDNIVKSSLKNNLNLIYLSVDIFSASTLVKQLYIKDSQEDYVIWKICNNNRHTLAVYNGDHIKLYVKLKKKNNEYVKDFHAGNKHDLAMIVDLLNQTLIQQSSNINMKNIFIYQIKENKDTLKRLISLDCDNLKVIDLNILIPQKKNNFFKSIPYSENGIAFKGLDL